MYTVHFACGIRFGCYTIGNNEEMLTDFNKGNDRIMHFRNILGSV